MHLTKHHGLGNDFLVVLDDPSTGTVAPADDRLPELARRLCDRHRGLGADGLIAGRRPPEGSSADVVMVLHNADGSRAEMSGNGIRCLAQAVVAARGGDGATLTIATDGGDRQVTVTPVERAGEVAVRVAMGTVGSGPAVPASLLERLGGSRHATVDVGNPHLVVEVADPSAVDLATEGPALEAAFPDGINVEFVAAGPDDRLELVVWERGAGITEACGTGACAAASVAHRWGVVGEHVEVGMPGGSAQVVLEGDDATLIGPSVRIADVDVDDEVLA